MRSRGSPHVISRCVQPPKPHPLCPQDAADDLQRILAELTALEEAAGMNRSAAGGGAATSVDYCEGAEVSELE